MISFQQVCKRYANGKDALQQVSFQLDVGELAFLTGHSGAGKSTLLKLLTLIERPTQGQIIVDNQNLSAITRMGVPYYRRKIGMVFQNHQLLFDRTVFDNVALPLLISGYSRKDAGRRVRAALDKVGLLSKENLLPIMLSGGEQQRVNLAVALASPYPLLLLDEPTASLDPNNRKIVCQLISEALQQDCAVLAILHDEKSVATLATQTFDLTPFTPRN